MKKIKLMAITAVFCALFATTAFAGTWKKDAKGWWWDNGNGTKPTECWQWCDGNGDGTAECYYFDKDGYCLMDATTPDGYKVNKDGAWVENGTVQTQGTATGIAAAAAGSKACDGSGVSTQTILSKLGYGAAYDITDYSKPEWESGVTNLKYPLTRIDYYTGNPLKGGGYCYLSYPGGIVAMAVNEDGYLLADTYTPDGYYVNKNGAVEVNGQTVEHIGGLSCMYAVSYDDGTLVDPNNCDFSRISARNTHSMPNGFMPWGKLIYMCVEGTCHDPYKDF